MPVPPPEFSKRCHVFNKSEHWRPILQLTCQLVETQNFKTEDTHSPTSGLLRPNKTAAMENVICCRLSMK